MVFAKRKESGAGRSFETVVRSLHLQFLSITGVECMHLRKRITAVTALLPLLLLLACHKKDTPTIALEECDPAGFIRCIQPDAFLSVPITDTNLLLTYSSRWSDRRLSEEVRNASALALGGWSLNLVHQYDFKNRVLINGDGTW